VDVEYCKDKDCPFLFVEDNEHFCNEDSNVPLSYLTYCPEEMDWDKILNRYKE